MKGVKTVADLRAALLLMHVRALTAALDKAAALEPRKLILKGGR